jgi:hypothetical protein
MADNVNATAFIPQIWDASVQRTLEDNLVALKISRTRPAKGAKKSGDTVYFSGLADPTISDYTGSITYEALDSGSVALLIDQQKSYAFKVTDPEQAMANVDLKGSQTSRAAYQLKKSVDTYIMSLYTGADSGNLITDATCDSATILSDVSSAVRKLEEQNVMEGDMWMTIPPWVKEKLVLAGVVFQINTGTTEKGTMAWANYLGIDMFVTNQVNNTGSAAAPVSQCMFGAYDAIVYDSVLDKSRMMELEGSFAYGCSGLNVFGAKVIRPKELGYMNLTYAAETAI